MEAIQARARKDRTSVSWILDNFDLARAGNVVIGKSAALVFVNADSGEQYITVDGKFLKFLGVSCFLTGIQAMKVIGVCRGLFLERFAIAKRNHQK